MGHYVPMWILQHIAAVERINWNVCVELRPGAAKYVAPWRKQLLLLQHRGYRKRERRCWGCQRIRPYKDIGNSSIIYVDKSILQNLFPFYYPLYVYKHATELRFWIYFRIYTSSFYTKSDDILVRWCELMLCNCNIIILYKAFIDFVEHHKLQTDWRM